MENNLKYISRLRIIRNHLANSKGFPNDLEKWRTKANITFDKGVLTEVYYPFHRDLRENVHKIIIENKEFK